MNIDKKEFRKYAAGHCHVKTEVIDNYISAVENSSLPKAMTPYITEEREMRVAQMDVFSRLMMDRIIFLGQEVNDNIANIIQAQLLFLQSTDAKRDIQMYINSPGGSVYSGFGI
ncbi:MAG: ATP-dependent Clp protease proteolytic subunit, partial [Mucilaginibacter sp.]